MSYATQCHYRPRREMDYGLVRYTRNAARRRYLRKLEHARGLASFAHHTTSAAYIASLYGIGHGDALTLFR